jgi:cytochrome c556
MKALARGVALGVLTCVAAAAVADDQDAVDYRKHVMSTLGEQLAAIDQIVAKKAPPDAFAVHVKTVAIAAGQAKLAFEPKVAGGNSKPEVWSNWADFAKRVDAMVAAANELAKAAQEGNVAAVGPKIRTALDCDGCHKIYMVPAKH